MYSTRAILVVSMGLAFGLAATAQEPAQERNSAGIVMLDLDSQGGAVIRLYGGDWKLPSPVASHVGAVLGCRLEQVQDEHYARYGWLQARCPNLLRRSGLAVEGQIDLAPLFNLLRSSGGKELKAYVNVSGLGSTPVRVDGWIVSGTNYTYETASGTAPPPLHVLSGFRSRELLLLAATLAVLWIVPVALTLYLQPPVLDCAGPDPDRLFGYQCFFGWIITGAYFFWFFAAEALHIGALASYLAGGSKLVGELLRIVLSAAPPILAHGMCAALSHRVFAPARGAEWTRRDAIRQAVIGDVSFLLPILLFLAGLEAVPEGFRVAAVWWLASFLAYVFLAAFQLKAEHFDLRAITQGELRDRVFALAEKARVALQQFYFVPSGRGQMPNAFAANSNQVVITEHLVQRLSKREVDAVVAHELAHLKSGHTGAFPIIMGLAIAFSTLWVNTAGRVWNMAAYLPVGSLCAFLVFFFVSRRRERSADARAIALTGDPEALMTALAKLARLNLQPLDWGRWQEQWLTHPSMLRRSQAIARLGGVAPERVPEILNAPEAEAEHYSIPAAARHDRQVLSARPKNGVVNLWELARLGIRVGLPLLVAYILQTGLLEGASAGALAVAGLALTFVADQLVRGSLHISEYRNLQRQMAARLREEGIDPQADNVVFIGFGPDPHPRVYESHDDWDVGFLVLASDRLCYIGGQTRFALKPEHIVDVRLGPGWPAWWPAHRVYVTWRDEERGTGGAFNFCPAPAQFEWQQSAAARRLQQTLEAWRARPRPASALQPALAELETPSIGAVTGHSPATLASFRAMRASTMETLVVAYLLSAGLSGSYAWYVYAVGLAAVILADIPFLLYRDPAPAEIGRRPPPAEAITGETRQSVGERGASWLVRAASALGLGVVATVAGAALYYAAFRLTGWRLTLLAIPIGLGVGYAVKLGSRGVGGRGYRILAAYLTFVAVFVPDLVRVTTDLGRMLQGMNARGHYWPEPSAKQVQLANEQTRELQAMPISEHLMVVWPALMFLPVAFAVMIFPYVFMYPLASIPVGAGMWLAWRQNRAP